MPRYAILIKATLTTEGKGTAAPDTLEAIGKFNEEMVAAGILLGGEGLRPTSEGYRVRFSAGDDAPSSSTARSISRNSRLSPGGG
jgi:hypothetical protein